MPKNTAIQFDAVYLHFNLDCMQFTGVNCVPVIWHRIFVQQNNNRANGQ